MREQTAVMRSDEPWQFCDILAADDGKWDIRGQLRRRVTTRQLSVLIGEEVCQTARRYRGLHFDVWIALGPDPGTAVGPPGVVDPEAVTTKADDDQSRTS